MDDLNTNSNNNSYGNIGGYGSDNIVNNYAVYRTDSKSRANEEPLLLQNFRKNFPKCLIATIIYSLIFTFSLFKNLSGIASALFAFASCAYVLYTCKVLQVTIKKYSIFYGVIICLLGINLFCTLDVFILIFDYIFIITTVYIFGMVNFYDMPKNKFFEYLNAFLESSLGSIQHLADLLYDVKKYNDMSSDSDSDSFFKRIFKSKIKYVFIGIVISIPILAVVLSLLGSSDVFFGEFLSNVIKKIIPKKYSFVIFISDSFKIVILAMIGFLVAYFFLKSVCNRDYKEKIREKKKYSEVIAITVDGILAFVYILYSGFQIFYLFLGNLTLPEGYTYAEYAREGFFELVVVCIINMFLVMIGIYSFKESKVLKVLLTLISICTYVMIASSAIRMYMYVSNYCLTYTRIIVFWSLAIIFFGMTGIMIYIYKNSFPLLKYFAMVILTMYTLFAFSNPQKMIATHNLKHQFVNYYYEVQDIDNYEYYDANMLDVDYLASLGIDATAAFADAIEREDNSEFTELFISNVKDVYLNYDVDSFRQFNLSWYFSKKIAEKY